jgi:WD repeat and SOF domain-containing protein 1
MKIKTISRSEEEFTRERSGDLMKSHRNLDPTIHPLERAREVRKNYNASSGV